MVEVSAKVIDIINSFIEEAAKNNVKISNAVLFGSHAKGTNTEWSDIDIAIISEDFSGNRFLDSEKIADAIIKTSIDIESHTYRPEDFNTSNPFVKEILSYGIRIL